MNAGKDDGNPCSKREDLFDISDDYSVFCWILTDRIRCL